MSTYTLLLISGAIGLILAIIGFFVGALLTKYSYEDLADERYEQGYDTGERVGWYNAADRLERVAGDMVRQGMGHRAAVWKSAARYLNRYFDREDEPMGWSRFTGSLPPDNQPKGK